uniref:30S ribosomal protein S2 n=1 Tax=Nephromyces sp. ex Molgula occidentalis TaxID=2544991 RepID=A0A5C1H7N0_9APIC|nr:30S ribosomal protein S2 [Nephromyces sp. ex Molgula occidentalis]
MNLISLNNLLNARVQIGCSSNKSLILYKKKFIYKIINNICIIDLIQTYKYLLKAYILFYKLGIYNEKILFIDSISRYQQLIEKSALLTNQFYLTKYFIPGTLTNWKIIYQNIILLNWFYKLNLFMEQNNILKNLDKKFQSKLIKIYLKLKNKFNLLKNIISIPNTIFILNIKTDYNALKEAKKLNKLIISIIDSDSNPNLINFPIPGNNKNYFSIKWLLEILITGLLQGNFKYKNLLN